jgi:PAP_fibrillin
MLGKAELLEAIAGKNRGLLATDAEKQTVLAKIAQLEDRNPTPRPIEAADLLEGDWRLLYTTSRGILGIDQVPLLNLGQVYQCIRLAEAKLYNIAEVIGLPMLEGIVSVAASVVPTSERRVNVMFERSILGLQRLIGYQSPKAFIQEIETGRKFAAIDFPITNTNQKGWLDTTYLDADLRIGRGNEGSVFVLTKECNH